MYDNCKLAIDEFQEASRKATGFKSLRVNSCEINQLKWICQMIFLESYKKSLKEKSEHRHQILSTGNAQGTKFQLKRTTTLNLSTKLSQKDNFQSKI